MSKVQDQMSAGDISRLINKIKDIRSIIAELWRNPKLTGEVGGDLFKAIESLKLAEMSLTEERNRLWVEVEA